MTHASDNSFKTEIGKVSDMKIRRISNYSLAEIAERTPDINQLISWK